jgi:hypothetical protein
MLQRKASELLLRRSLITSSRCWREASQSSQQPAAAVEFWIRQRPQQHAEEHNAGGGRRREQRLEAVAAVEAVEAVNRVATVSAAAKPWPMPVSSDLLARTSLKWRPALSPLDFPLLFIPVDNRMNHGRV